MKIILYQDSIKKTYTKEEILKGTYKNNDLKAYFKESLLFCEMWLNGYDNFQMNTSGSTGKPKVINISREQMLTSAAATAKALKLKKKIKSLVCINTKYIGGKMMLVRGLIMDWEIHLIEPTRNPIKYLLSVDKTFENFNFTALVPLQLSTMLNANNDAINNILDSFQTIIVGGASISASLRLKINDSLSQVNIYSTYGMTETVSHIALQKLNDTSINYFTLLPEILIAKDGRNCLKIKGKVSNNQWLITNDLVNIIDKHHFYLLGRIDNVINTGGVKIQAESLEKKIEKVLLSMGLEVRFFVKGLPDEALGEHIVLFLEMLNNNLVSEKLKSELSKYEVPKIIHYIKNFEETQSGKVNRRKTVNKILTKKK